MRSIAKSVVPERRARISVWPVWGWPAAASASLLMGAVTMPSRAPDWQSRTAVSM